MHGGRELLAPHRAVIGERTLVRHAQLRKSQLDLLMKRFHQLLCAHAGQRCAAFRLELGLLQRRERLPLSVGEVKSRSTTPRMC